MILKLGMNHLGLKVYKVYINDEPGLTYLRQDQIWSKCLLCLYMYQAQISDKRFYRTICPLVLACYAQTKLSRRSLCGELRDFKR